ncbi:membrane protein insertase YidC [Actinomyces viscosus]|uniref:membrane protein insertase YidC n=1 Tax=Actinomyces viscosus TaxID=1656 RepID=UPI0028EFBA6F|nr:membrane protein insertase YidC [Actinomyces viscosus]
MDTLLWPLKVAVAWVMVTIHKALVLVGFPDGPGVAWVLSIIGLTIVVRLLIMPLFVKQIRASRGMQLLQPEMQALQAKYKGKKDPESRQRMNEEMMALYRKHGTNPMASCLPILVQMPIFFALFRVLASLGAVAGGTYGRPSIGPLTMELAKQVQDSSVFGASLSSSFMSSGDNTQVKIVTVAMIIIMSVTQWYTMAQLTMKNMSTESMNSDNPMIRSQRMMMYVMPVIFAVSGVNFQIGVLVYWVVSNLWTMGQQFFTIRNMPAPGSEAEKKYRERVNAKRARKGLPSLEEEERAEAVAKAEAEGRTGGQRVQPVRKSRQKKSGGQSDSRGEARADVVGDSDVEQIEDASDSQDTGPKNSSSSKSGGLSDEEIARRRYERRARQRREAAARRKAQAKKKRNR